MNRLLRVPTRVCMTAIFSPGVWISWIRMLSASPPATEVAFCRIHSFTSEVSINQYWDYFLLRWGQAWSSMKEFILESIMVSWEVTKTVLILYKGGMHPAIVYVLIQCVLDWCWLTVSGPHSLVLMMVLWDWLDGWSGGHRRKSPFLMSEEGGKESLESKWELSAGQETVDGLIGSMSL